MYIENRSRTRVYDNTMIVLKYTYLILLCLLAIFPFIWVFISSFKTSNQIFLSSFSLPESWAMTNYKQAWVMSNIPLGFLNSMLYTFTSFIIIALISTMAAYVITKVMSGNWLLLFFTLGMMIPIHSVLIPLFIIQKNLGILYTKFALILLYIAMNLSLSIFIMSGFLKSLPKDIEEAAIIDGCSRTKSFFYIVFPLVTPALATISIFNYLFVWNDFIFANVFGSLDRLNNLTVALYNAFKGEYTTDYGAMTAGIIISIIPTLIAYSAFQSKIVDGVVAGSVKG